MKMQTNGMDGQARAGAGGGGGGGGGQTMRQENPLGCRISRGAPKNLVCISHHLLILVDSQQSTYYHFHKIIQTATCVEKHV